MAYGFVIGKNTYLRNSWNVLDFIIVLSSLVGDSELKLIRLIRVMKPLRTIRRIPTLRKQTEALIESLRGVVNVAALLAFAIFFFGIIGL